MRAASIGSRAAASSFASSPSSSGLRRLPFPSSALNSAVSSATAWPVGLREITRPPVNACRTNQWYTPSALLITSVRFECVNSAIWSTRASSVALRTGCTLAILSSHSFTAHIILQYPHIRAGAVASILRCPDLKTRADDIVKARFSRRGGKWRHFDDSDLENIRAMQSRSEEHTSELQSP